jgi:hypothetical protein
MMMTFIPESFRVAPESFGVVSAVIVAVLAAIVITGFWEFLIQEIKLKRLEQKRGRQIAANQNIKSDRDPDSDNGIDIGGGRDCATDAKSVQSSMRHFARAVERLQKLDSKRMGDDPIIHRVTQDLASDLRGIWLPATWQKATCRAAKICPYCSTAKVLMGNFAGRRARVAVVRPTNLISRQSEPTRH